jgi:acetolactate synthase-1/2/3 large subunit
VTLPAGQFVEWLAARLARAGLTRGFGVPGGGSSLDLMAALRHQGVATVVTAREDAAVMMAGVTGALAGTPGLAFTTKGPGLAAAANGLASAALDRLPALLVTEAFEAAELGFLSHQVFDQAELVAPLLRVGGAEVLAPDEACVETWIASSGRPPRRPAVVFPGAAAPERTASPEPPAAGDQERAAALLAASRRPVVIVGLEATCAATAAALRPFVERLGAPTLVSYMAKGCLPDGHPLYAGIFTGGAVERPCVGEADLIVLVGLDPIELIRQPWAYQAPVLDLCEAAHEPHYVVPEVRLTGPLDESLEAMTAGARQSSWTAIEIAGHRQHYLRGMEIAAGGGLNAVEVVKAAARAFGAKARLAVDAGAHMFSACAFWNSAQPLDLLISNGLASMGFAVPAAIAAALYDPERGALAITGDGGLMMCLGELKTAAETGARICVVVCNDGRLSLIDIKRAGRQLPDLGLTWQPPDFAAVARGFGLAAWRVEQSADLASAFTAAAVHEGPSLIDVRLDPSGYPDQLRALRG